MNGKNRRIRVRGIKRHEPDLRKLARAIIDLAIELNDQQQEQEPGDGEGQAA